MAPTLKPVIKNVVAASVPVGRGAPVPDPCVTKAVERSTARIALSASCRCLSALSNSDGWD